MSGTPDDFVRELRAAWPPERWRDVTVLVAVSGGADSVALARGLAAVRESGEGRLILAHFNHRLRGAHSDADEAFVRRLADDLGLEIVVGQGGDDLAVGGSGEGPEGAARQARYAFLTSAAADCGARYVATAHTADDQVETVLFNVLRGTGLAGLAGIPRVRRLTDAATLVRPLLQVRRQQIEAYLNAHGQSYVTDETNASLAYTRNRIRHELLPLVRGGYNAEVDAALLRLAAIAEQADDFLEQEAEKLLSAAKCSNSACELDLSGIRDAHLAIVRQALLLIWRHQNWPLQAMSADKWERVMRLVGSSPENRSENLPGGLRAERRGDVLWIGDADTGSRFAPG